MKLKKEVKIGIFGLSMVALLFWGINFLKGKDIFTSTRTYYATFQKADGLNNSTEIFVRGVKMGSITNVYLDPKSPERIIVEFAAHSQYKIPNDSRLVVFNKYILAGTVLNLEYGISSEYFQNRDTIPSVGAVDFVKLATEEVDNVKNKTLALIENLNTTLDGVNKLLSEENIKNISSTIEGVNTIVTGDLSKVAGNLNTLSESLSDNSGRINNIIGNVEALTDSLRKLEIKELVSNVNTTVNSLNRTLDKINKGEGSAAKFINDPMLYDSLVRASNNLSLLLDDLKERPGRYVRFSIFGGKKE